MTRSSSMPWRTLSVLLTVNVALAGFLATERRRDTATALPTLPPVAMAASGQAGAAEDASTALPSLGPLGSYATVLERPLFLPGRRPFAPEKPAAPPPTTPGGEPTLKGVIVTAERAVAIFQLPGSAQYIFGEQGSAVGSWRVEEIGPDSVSLRRGGIGRLLVLEDRGAPTPGPAARPAAPGNTDEARPAGDMGAAPADRDAAPTRAPQ